MIRWLVLLLALAGCSPSGAEVARCVEHCEKLAGAYAGINMAPYVAGEAVDCLCRFPMYHSKDGSVGVGSVLLK